MPSAIGDDGSDLPRIRRAQYGQGLAYPVARAGDVVRAFFGIGQDAAFID